MKKIYIDDFAEIADIMYQDACAGKETTFVGLYDDVTMVLQELCKFDEVFLISVSLHPEDYDGYNKEYYVTLDDDFGAWCCEAYNEERGRYAFDFAHTALIADDCNSKVIDALEVEEMYEVTFDLYGDTEECNGDCEHCSMSTEHEDDDHSVVTRVAVDDKGKIHGFKKTWSSNDGNMHYHSTYTYYSNNEDMLKRMMDNFNIKH